MAVTVGAQGVTARVQKIRTHRLSDAPLFALVAFLVGMFEAAMLLGWQQIDPHNLSWLRGDAAVYEAGWEFLRRQAWTFPPSWLAHLDYPSGISAAYLDVIPILAVPLHVFAGFLPSNFQYLGAWAAICLILQAYFGMRLLSCFTTDRLLIVIGALFFLNSPILLLRLYGHFSLCSQWLIVAALYCYFRPLKRRNLVAYLSPFAVLVAIAGGITPYIAVMVLLIGLAALLRAYLERQNGRGDESAELRGAGASALRQFLGTNHVLWAAILAVSMVASFVFFGFVTFGGSPTLADKGYGMFSMNLLSPIAALGQSAFPNPFHVFFNQEYEGYNYLGLGVVLLGVIALVRHRTSLSALGSPSLRPLVIASALLTLLALSIRVTAGQTVLLIFPAPAFLFHLLAIFRASGRFFWPVSYLLLLGAIVGGALTMRAQWARRTVLAAALALQLFDTLPLRAAVAERARITVSNPLAAADWTAVAGSMKHLVILPARQCDSTLTPGGDAAWPWFARLAARNGMTLNSVYSARISSASKALNCTVLPQEVAAGKVGNDTTYVLSDRLARLAEMHARALACRRVDGFNLCTAGPQPIRAVHSVVEPRPRTTRRTSQSQRVRGSIRTEK